MNSFEYYSDLAINPNTDDFVSPSFKIIWVSKESNNKGECSFFSYGNGIDFVKTVFNTLYPGRKIIQIQKIEI